MGRESLQGTGESASQAQFAILEKKELRMGHKIKPKICDACKITKGWGEEILIENNELYCGKLLVFKKGCKFSMHYHLLKDETWYVERGEFIYRWIDTENADVHEVNLKDGDIVRQRVGQPHQLEALTE